MPPWSRMNMLLKLQVLLMLGKNGRERLKDWIVSERLIIKEFLKIISTTGLKVMEKPSISV